MVCRKASTASTRRCARPPRGSGVGLPAPGARQPRLVRPHPRYTRARIPRPCHTSRIAARSSASRLVEHPRARDVGALRSPRVERHRSRGAAANRSPLDQDRAPFGEGRHGPSRHNLNLLLAERHYTSGARNRELELSVPPNHCPCCYFACMPSITIRDVPEDTRDELAARAARSGRSLQEYLRQELVELAGRPDPNYLAQRIHERKTRTSSTLSAAQILEHRDAGRR